MFSVSTASDTIFTIVPRYLYRLYFLFKSLLDSHKFLHLYLQLITG